MDALPTPLIEEQIEAVQAARDLLVRSAQWRAGRKGFDKTRHAREVRRLNAAIATLEERRNERDSVMAVLLGPKP